MKGFRLTRVKRFHRVASGFLLVVFAGCGPRSGGPAEPGHDRMTQISVVSALMVGRYDGVATIPDLLREGDFGIGTLDHLDGELIILDGIAYQVRADGVIAKAGAGRSTPFATVVRFRPDGVIPCPAVASLAELDDRLNSAIPRKNSFVAIRIKSTLASITLRSVKRQEPPYRPLAEVAKSQSVWTHANLSGTLLGTRCPTWAGGLNVPGFHWHFLSDDHSIGGHVLDCRVSEGRVEFDVCREWLVRLEDSRGFDQADLGQDLSRELRKVESSRGDGQEGKPDSLK